MVGDTWHNWSTTAAVVNATWTIWCSDGGTTTACNDTSRLWTGWCGNTSTATSNIWIRWNEGTGEVVQGVHGAWPAWNRACQVPRGVETAEEIAAREERARRANEEWNRKQLASKKAQERALELLREFLSEEDRRMLEQQNKFRVVGSDGKRYEVEATRHHQNVFELDDKLRRIVQFCIYQTGGLPMGDNHLAQKLLLEADAEEFRRIAHATRLAG